MTEVSKNEELKAKLTAIDRSDMKTAIPQAIKLAKEYGFELIEDDLTMDKASVEGVMDDDALDVVAGGANKILVDMEDRCEDPADLVCCCANGLGVEVSSW